MGRERMRSNGFWLTPVAALAVLLFSAALASAEGTPTRSEYVTTLESTCKPDALETQRVMKGARAEVREERLRLASVKFSKATKIYGGTVEQISAVPRPPSDAERLSRWFTYLKRQVSYLKQITVQLRVEHAIKAQRLVARFIHNGNLANNVVLSFGFNYCSFKFSRFG